MAAPCVEADGLDSPSARRVHFAMGAENAAVGANGLIKLPSCTPEATGWKVRAYTLSPRSCQYSRSTAQLPTESAFYCTCR